MYLCSSLSVIKCENYEKRCRDKMIIVTNALKGNGNFNQLGTMQSMHVYLHPPQVSPKAPEGDFF